MNINVQNVGSLIINNAPEKQQPNMHAIVNRLGQATSLLQAIVAAECTREGDKMSPYCPGLEFVANELDEIFAVLLELT